MPVLKMAEPAIVVKENVIYKCYTQRMKNSHWFHLFKTPRSKTLDMIWGEKKKKGKGREGGKNRPIIKHLYVRESRKPKPAQPSSPMPPFSRMMNFFRPMKHHTSPPQFVLQQVVPTFHLQNRPRGEIWKRQNYLVLLGPPDRPLPPPLLRLLPVTVA